MMGLAPRFRIVRVNDIRFDSAGELYVLSTGTDSVLKFAGIDTIAAGEVDRCTS